ncbi:hypothetical protein [Desulfocurvus sp.]|jgi:SpoVK/Ycf46/Vps4 family AAA+-type ATPase|uniref:hypothetical protein n=1 Tax=Desulfocurvus sp. TaxID=2871698 RepID=UPI00342E04D8
MALTDLDYLDKIEAFMTSGDMAFEFEHGDEARRLEILEFLERLMDLAELADAQATRLIFKDGYMDMLADDSAQK